MEGVVVKELIRHCDDRGYLTELVRDDDNLLEHFGQATFSMSYPGVIKAFHYHEKQDDLWFFPSGNAQVVLHDLRKNSSTSGKTETYYMGENNPILLLIPKGVAHGYRVLGCNPATLIYFTTTSYNPKNPDEKRLSWDDKQIDFDWQTHYR